jgi:hypothetical protein
MACRVGMQRRRQGWVEGAPGVRCQLEAKPRRPKAPGPISRDGVAIFAYLAWEKSPIFSTYPINLGFTPSCCLLLQDLCKSCGVKRVRGDFEYSLVLSGPGFSS